MTAALRVLYDRDDLRQHLDQVNDAGDDNQAVGMDAHGNTFLASLAGAYAESETVILADPWNQEVDLRGSTQCDSCGASTQGDLDSLSYPVTVIVRSGS